MCGGAAPLAVEGKALSSPRGYWEAGAQRCVEHSRAGNPTIFHSIYPTGVSLFAEFAVLSYTPWNGLPKP